MFPNVPCFRGSVASYHSRWNKNYLTDVRRCIESVRVDSQNRKSTTGRMPGVAWLDIMRSEIARSARLGREGIKTSGYMHSWLPAPPGVPVTGLAPQAPPFTWNSWTQAYSTAVILIVIFSLAWTCLLIGLCIFKTKNRERPKPRRKHPRRRSEPLSVRPRRRKLSVFWPKRMRALSDPRSARGRHRQRPQEWELKSDPRSMHGIRRHRYARGDDPIIIRIRADSAW